MNKKDFGKFIETQRKEKGLTVTQLANKLYVSEKTLSNWENGKGLPDTSIMILLCKELDVNVCELLSAKRLDDDYKTTAEEHLLDLIATKKKSRASLIVAIIGMVTLFVIAIALAFVAEYAGLPYEYELAVGITATVLIFFSSIGVVPLFITYTSFECPHCKHQFTPSTIEFIFAPHTATTKRLTCPKCKTKSFCPQRIKK